MARVWISLQSTNNEIEARRLAKLLKEHGFYVKANFNPQIDGNGYWTVDISPPEKMANARRILEESTN